MTSLPVSPLTSPVTALGRRIDDRTAMVAVVGLGYVGLPLLVAAGAERFRLIGVARTIRAESVIRL